MGRRGPASHPARNGDRAPDPHAYPHGKHAVLEGLGPHIHISSPKKLVLNCHFSLDLLALRV